MRTSPAASFQAEALRLPTIAPHALLVSLAMWGLGIAAALGACFAIVVHGHGSTGCALQWESFADGRSAEPQCENQYDGKSRRSSVT
jgi:hypothetical protein